MANGQSVLQRVGQGVIAFGAGTTSSDIDRIRADRDIAEQDVELGRQEIDLNQAAITRQQRQQELTNLAFSGGPESDTAAAKLSVEFPEIFENISESMGLRSQGQKNEAADFALRLRNTPFNQRQPLIDERVNTLTAAGRDAQHTASLTGQAEEDQNNSLRVTELLALSPEERLTQARGADVPAEQQAFESLIEGFSPEDQTKARRVKARIDAPAGTSSAERIALNQELTALVAASQARIGEEVAFAKATGVDRAKRVDAGFESIQKIDANIRTLDKVIAAIDEGASTGVIESRFLPTIREATVELEQLQAQLGLDVIGSVQFGALSEGELNLALETALPTGLQPAQLRQWVESRKTAQGKLRDYYSEQIQFLDQGGTVAGFMRAQERQTEATPETGDVIRFDAEGNPIQ